ncbi:MAG: hypothetical protein POG24_08245 [Acidocella sp.]|nr:hypothetical protein [Acidocella sp.]
MAIEKVRQEGPLGRPDDIQHLDSVRIRDVLKYRLGQVRSTVWRSNLRQRIIPTGSERERAVVNFYRRTIGRFVGE